MTQRADKVPTSADKIPVSVSTYARGGENNEKNLAYLITYRPIVSTVSNLSAVVLSPPREKLLTATRMREKRG